MNEFIVRKLTVSTIFSTKLLSKYVKMHVNTISFHFCLHRIFNYSLFFMDMWFNIQRKWFEVRDSSQSRFFITFMSITYFSSHHYHIKSIEICYFTAIKIAFSISIIFTLRENLVVKVRGFPSIKTRIKYSKEMCKQNLLLLL